MPDFNQLTEHLAVSCVQLLGGVSAIYHHTADVPTTVIVERGVEVAINGGVSYLTRTVLGLLKKDVGRAEIGATVITSTDTFIIAGFVAEDDEIIEVYTQ